MTFAEDYATPKELTNAIDVDTTDPGEYLDLHDVLFSPDGMQIAFASTRHGNFEIYIMDLDGSNIQRLTDNPAVEASPVWSPDGDRIAFVSLRDGNVEVYVVNADGSNLQRLTQNNYNDFEIDWSPDGRYIAVSSQVSTYANIYLIDVEEALQVPDSHTRQQLTDTEAVDAFPRWSPNGMQIVFESNRDGNFELYIMNSDGSEVQRLTNSEADDLNPDWQPAPFTT